MLLTFLSEKSLQQNAVAPSSQTQNLSNSTRVSPPVLLSSNIAANQIIFTIQINTSNLEYTIDGGNNWISATIFTLNNSSYFRADNLTNGQSYTVSARAIDNGTRSGISNAVTATPNGTVRQLLYNANPYGVNIPVGTLVKYVLVGGGGGGASSFDTGSSGGGGGGMVLNSTFVANGSFVTVQVCNGGTGGRSITSPARTDENGNPGQDSTISVVGTNFSVAAKGGSGGLSSRSGTAGQGGAAANPPNTAAGGGAGGYSAATTQGSGGGGGAGTNGGNSINGAAGQGGQPVSVNLEGTTGTFGRGGDGVANGQSTVSGVSAAQHSGNGGSGSRAASSFSIAGGNCGSGVAWLYF